MNGATNKRFDTVIFGIPAWGWLLLLSLGVGLVFFKKISNWISDTFRVKNTVKELQAANSGTDTEQKVKQCASEAWAAIWGGFGIFEDEKRFINAILSCPYGYIPQMAVHYAKIENKGKNMYNDALKYLSKTQYDKIKNLL